MVRWSVRRERGAVTRPRPRPSGRGPGPARSRGSGCSRTSRPASVRDRRLHPAGELGRAGPRGTAGWPGVLTPSASIARSPSTPPVIVTTLVRPRCVEDRLGRRRLVVAERDRRRTDEQRAERLADRVLRGDPHQAVLHDAVAHVLLAQGAADLRDLLDGEAAVLGDDQRPAAGERLAQLGDGLPLGLGGHACPPASSARPVRGGGAPRSAEPRRPCDGACFGWPDTQGRCHREGGATGPASACSPSSPALSRRRSGPADQAPTVTARAGVAVRGRRLSLAVPSVFSCDDASLATVAAMLARPATASVGRG